MSSPQLALFNKALSLGTEGFSSGTNALEKEQQMSDTKVTQELAEALKVESLFQILAEGLDACVDTRRGWNSTHEQAKNLANAAPELLEALENIRVLINGAATTEQLGSAVEQIYKTSDTAIRKVKGEL